MQKTKPMLPWFLDLISFSEENRLFSSLSSPIFHIDILKVIWVSVKKVFGNVYMGISVDQESFQQH